MGTNRKVLPETDWPTTPSSSFVLRATRLRRTKRGLNGFGVTIFVQPGPDDNVVFSHGIKSVLLFARLLALSFFGYNYSMSGDMVDFDKWDDLSKSHAAYFAPDGLMELWEEALPRYYEGAEKPTAENDNGILFLVTYLWLMRDQTGHLPLSVQEKLKASLNSCSRRITAWLGPDYDGLYDRCDYRSDSLNSLDNYTAMVSGFILANDPGSIQKIVSYGERHNWFFNNQDTKSKRWGGWRQWSDRALYKICAGLKPSWFERFYLRGSIYVQALQGTAKRDSETLLLWIWIKTLTHLDKTKEYQSAIDFWIKKLGLKGGIAGVIERYYKDSRHPNRLLSVGKAF